MIVTARTRERAVAAASGLIERGAAPERVHAEALDVADPAGARICGRRLAEAGIAVDVLVNNAALYPDKARAEQGVLDSPPGDWRALMEANFFGALWACREFVPGMLRARVRARRERVVRLRLDRPRARGSGPVQRVEGRAQRAHDQARAGGPRASAT